MQVRPLRITLIIHALNGGGAERQICSLASYLASHDLSCTLITLDRHADDRYLLDSRVTRISLNQMRSSRSVFDAVLSNRERILAVREAVLRSQPNCVISFCDKMNVVTLAACRSLSIPIIISERSDPRRQKLGWMWEAARRWHYPKSTACVAQTAGVADYLRKIIGTNSKIEIIPSAIEPPPNAFLTSHSLTNRPLTLLYVGRLSHEKGPDRLIQAWSKLVAKHPAWKLVLVGEGPLRTSLNDQCEDLSIQQSVNFLGWKEDVWSQLYQAQAFVLPSRYEGFPGAMLEAMYAGLAVTATDCSDSIRDMIDHQKNGLIADNDTESLTAQLDRIMTDAPLREQLGNAARPTATKFLWSQVGKGWKKLIQEVTSPP